MLYYSEYGLWRPFYIVTIGRYLGLSKPYRVAILGLRLTPPHSSSISNHHRQTGNDRTALPVDADSRLFKEHSRSQIYCPSCVCISTAPQSLIGSLQPAQLCGRRQAALQCHGPPCLCALLLQTRLVENPSTHRIALLSHQLWFSGTASSSSRSSRGFPHGFLPIYLISAWSGLVGRGGGQRSVLTHCFLFFVS
ncbi:hypothetical protein BDW66DRAFT_46417 [Aspergillus desertorum]